MRRAMRVFTSPIVKLTEMSLKVMRLGGGRDGDRTCKVKTIPLPLSPFSCAGGSSGVRFDAIWFESLEDNFTFGHVVRSSYYSRGHDGVCRIEQDEYESEYRTDSKRLQAKIPRPNNICTGANATRNECVVK